MSIRKISLSGSYEYIGYQHGKFLGEQIHKNIDFYKSLFRQILGDETRILKFAKKFKDNIRSYNPNFVVEIDHIAIGAGVTEPLWLYALNSRTELSMLENIQECTAIVCPNIDLLGQTWDWAQNLEDNFVIMKITFPNGHKILQLTEAGIIGKIGLNNQGLGVTLNFLYDEHIDFSTVPIHITMRKVLESPTLGIAKNAVKKSKTGKASNLIIAQDKKAIDVEFAGDQIEITDIEGTSYVHTNHFLHAKPPKLVNEESLRNSITRLMTAQNYLNINENLNRNHLIELFSDQTNGKNSILAQYKPDPLEMLGDYGTLATIIMDLKERSIFVRNGNPKNDSFSANDFKKYFCS